MSSQTRVHTKRAKRNRGFIGIISLLFGVVIIGIIVVKLMSPGGLFGTIPSVDRSIDAPTNDVEAIEIQSQIQTSPTQQKVRAIDSAQKAKDALQGNHSETLRYFE